MTEIVLHFEMAEGEDAGSAARELEARLLDLDSVEDAQAAPEETRAVAEAITIIAAGVVLLKQGRELTDELAKFVASVKSLVREIRGLKQVFVEIGTERVPVSELDEQRLQALAEESG